MRPSLGTLAAGGTLGILIPPSVNMIVYGSLTNNSIGKLFIAGIIPGILLTLASWATSTQARDEFGQARGDTAAAPSACARCATWSCRWSCSAS
jgi:TRAP-type C4-dicarboxylate transport system permease large subunit